MSEDESPDWYDESKVVRAIFALENGYPTYGGHVMDLGDGTCRFTNEPLLGEGGPEWGDRVDLFYNPCDPFSRPIVGYRIYAEGEEPVGRSFGLKPDPTDEETKEWKEKQKRWEKAEMERFSRNSDAMFAPFLIFTEQHKTSDWILRYFELKDHARDNGVTVPDDLHRKAKSFGRDSVSDSYRKDLKTMLLASLRIELDDVEVTEEEIETLAEEIRASKAKSKMLAKKFAEQIAAFEDDEEEEIA